MKKRDIFVISMCMSMGIVQSFYSRHKRKRQKKQPSQLMSIPEVHREKPGLLIDTPLIAAVKDDDWGRIQLLLDEGVSVDEPNSDGETALMIAVRHGYTDIMRKLILAGASSFKVNNAGETILSIASRNMKNEMYKAQDEKRETQEFLEKLVEEQRVKKAMEQAAIAQMVKEYKTHPYSARSMALKATVLMNKRARERLAAELSDKGSGAVEGKEDSDSEIQYTLPRDNALVKMVEETDSESPQGR